MHDFKYLPFGLPATGTINVAQLPAVGDTVTVGTRTFTYGTDFFGDMRGKTARSLTWAINADPRFQPEYANQTNPATEACAVFYGDLVRVIATVPGTGGNTIGLSTSNSAAFTVSGTLLTGGTSGSNLSGTGSPQGVVTASPGQFYTDLTNPAAPAVWVKVSDYNNLGWVALIV